MNDVVGGYMGPAVGSKPVPIDLSRASFPFQEVIDY
jgi:hypothetical protein